MYEIKFSFNTFEELEAFNDKLKWMENNYTKEKIAGEKQTEEEAAAKVIPPISLEDALKQSAKAEPSSLTPQPGELEPLPEKRPVGRPKEIKKPEATLPYLRKLAVALIGFGYTKSFTRILKDFKIENLSGLEEIKYSSCQERLLEVFTSQRLQIPEP